MQNKRKLNSLVDIYILIVISSIILFLSALKDILEIFSYGILKKEILTEESKIGFDIKIKVK